jgi:hypothetical protein
MIMKLDYLVVVTLVLLAACAPAPIVSTPTAASSPQTTSTISPKPTVASSPQPTAPVVNLPPLATTTPVNMTDHTLVVYQKSGGIAGINEVITVSTDGKLELVESRQNLRRDTTVEPARLAKLYELIEKPEYNNLQVSYQAMGADLFTYRITTRTTDGKTRTVTTMDAAKHPEILGQVIAELNALRTLVR